jgi:hypothetical protein
MARQQGPEDLPPDRGKFLTATRAHLFRVTKCILGTFVMVMTGRWEDRLCRYHRKQSKVVKAIPLTISAA